MKSTKTEETTARQLPAEVHEIAEALTTTNERAQAAAKALTEAERDYTAAARTPGAPLDTLNKLRAARESARADATTLTEHAAHLRARLEESLQEQVGRNAPASTAARQADLAVQAEAQKRFQDAAQEMLLIAERARNEAVSRCWYPNQHALQEEVQSLARLCAPDQTAQIMDRARPPAQGGGVLHPVINNFLMRTSQTQI